MVKLLDQVTQARRPVEIEDETGRYRLRGAGNDAAQLAACPVRFVADLAVATYCSALLDTDRGMLCADNEFLRVPAPTFWLEWTTRAIAGVPGGGRTGLLVEANDTGRAGTVATYWEQRDDEPVAAQMTISFDLDDRRLYLQATGDTYALQPGSHPLWQHLLFRFEPDWRDHFHRHGQAAVLTAAASIIAGIVPGLEMLLAFSALLAERTCLSRRQVDCSRLNRQRRRNGRLELLDHVEVRLDLTSNPAPGRTVALGERHAARLHCVRGHMVHRAGHTFWRRSHLRGDPSQPVRPRNVSVTRGE